MRHPLQTARRGLGLFWIAALLLASPAQATFAAPLSFAWGSGAAAQHGAQEEIDLLDADVGSGAPEEGEEEIVDFAVEEGESARRDAELLGGVVGVAQSALASASLKLFVDLLVDYGVGEESWSFRPNHTYIIAEAHVFDNLMFSIHISDDPVFYELAYSVTPHLTLKAGKLFIPFGTNDFHHIMGGRVDELSHFLPETWSDYGVGLSMQLFDTDYASADYDLYLVNGFQGTDRPLIGAGTPSDNNMAKGYGARLKLTLLSHFVVTGSLYHDVWNADETRNLLFYSAGLELRPGFLPLPVVKRLRIRAEYGRGEFRLAEGNYLRGVLRHAYARVAFYTEALLPLTQKFSVRLRGGRINPDNTVTDDGDLWVLEPAIIIGHGKFMLLAAYQALILDDAPYSPSAPADLIYAKFFLQF